MERYREYMRAAGPIVARHGARKLDSCIPEEAIIGEFDADPLVVVEWPNQDVFEAFIADPEFEAIRHLRQPALTRSRLIRCRRV